MAMLKMDISMIRSRSTGQDTSLASRLDRMEAQINTTIGAMRRIAADLRPLTLDDLGLAAAIESLVHDFERRSGVRCKLAAQTQLDIPPGHATAVFRIVQEALTNVSKHAMASNVEVIISTADKQLTVVVRDDGIGFASDGPRKPQSYGLLGVRERAYLLGGQTRIASMPGRGTEIEVRLPAASSA
jgi:signal transduction histidine kinase